MVPLTNVHHTRLVFFWFWFSYFLVGEESGIQERESRKSENQKHGSIMACCNHEHQACPMYSGAVRRSRGKGLGIKEGKMETLGRRFDFDGHHANDGGRVTRQAGVIL